MNVMKNFKQNKLLVTAIVVVLSLSLFVQFSGLAVLSVDKIYLHQRGVGSAGEELKGGYWRVLASTQNSDVQFLSFAQDTVRSNTDPFNPVPSDVKVNGELFVQVYQDEKPYWVIPVTKVSSVTVTPKMYASKLTSNAWTWDTQVAVDPVSVELWRLNLAEKQVYIPFKVVAAKTLGENTGWLKTDDPTATFVQANYQMWRFTVSMDNFDGGQKAIKFYNPMDANEKFTLTLQWSSGDYNRYSWNENLMFVVPEATVANPQSVPTNSINTFLASDETAIRQMLDYQSTSEWKFNDYWFGGGLFTGSTMLSSSQKHSNFVLKTTEGASSGVIMAPATGGSLIPVHVAEGYSARSSTPNDIYEFAGWFTPRSGEEGFSGAQPSDWWSYRYPVKPQVYSGTNTKPEGKSICNYLSSSMLVNGKAKPYFQTRSIDVWGQGASLAVPNDLTVYMPTSARTFFFTMDISTEIVDTVVVSESYANVQVVNKTVSKAPSDLISPNDYASVSVTLKNTGQTGSVSVRIVPPNDLKLASSITGGDNAVYLQAGETKTLQLRVTNNGNLDKQTTGTFKIEVRNGQSVLTGSSEFQLTFVAGLGAKISQLKVNVLDAETRKGIGGISVRAEYGTNNFVTGSTLPDGSVLLDLGIYNGQVKVVVSDPSLTYQPETATYSGIQEGVQERTVYLVPFGSDRGTSEWLLFGGIAAFCATAIVITLIVKRKR